MEELIKILNIKDYDIEQYVESRIAILNSLHNDVDEISLTEVIFLSLSTTVPQIPALCPPASVI